MQLNPTASASLVRWPIQHIYVTNHLCHAQTGHYYIYLIKQ